MNNNNKLVIKNKSPKSKEEYLSKALSKKEFKSNRLPTKNINFYFNEKKSTSKVNIFNENKAKNKVIKKAPNNKNKKRQNKFFKKKVKDKEPSSLISNLNIYKIINSKDAKTSKAQQQSSSISTNSVKSYISNTSNKINNNKCISLLHKNENNIDNIKRKRLDLDISNNSSNNTRFYTSKENLNKIDSKKNYNCINSINKINIKLKNQNQIKKINMKNPNFIRNVNLENKQITDNIIEFSNTEEKKDIKLKEINNIYNNSNHKGDIKNNIKLKNININKDKKASKEKNKNIIKEKCNIGKDNERENVNLFTDNAKNTKFNLCSNSDNLDQKLYCIDLNNNNDNLINKDYYMKKKLNPVKKSLFSEHMNFLINHQENNNLYNNCNNNEIINKNCLKFHFDDILDSTDKKEYESKFINYDLGKTTGTSLSKDTLFLFGNKNNEKNKNTKIFNISKNENLVNIEEKEKTQEEMEKLAKEYLNMSKYWENRDENYKQKINLTNTITTVIDDNNSNEDTIL